MSISNNMDPLSITAGVIAVADKAFTVGKALYALYTNSKDVEETLQSLRSGVSNIEELCRQIDKHVKRLPQGELDDLDNKNLFNGIQSQLSDCSTLFKRINSKLEPVTEKKTGAQRLMRQWRLNMRKDEIDKCRTQIQARVQNLQLSLQLLNLQATYLVPKVVNRDLLEVLENIKDYLKTSGVSQRLRKCAGTFVNKGSTLYSTSVASSDGGWQDTSRPQAIADWIEQLESLRLRGTVPGRSSHAKDSLYSASSVSDPKEKSHLVEITKSNLSALNLGQNDEDDDFEHEMAEVALESGRQAYDASNHVEAEKMIKESLTLIQRLPRDRQQQFDIQEIHLLLALCAYYNYNPVTAEAALISALQRDTESYDNTIMRFTAASAITMVYIRLGKYDLAQLACYNVYRGRRKLLGKDDQSCFDTLALLGRIYELQDLHARAKAVRIMIPEDERDTLYHKYKDLVSDNPQTLSRQVSTDLSTRIPRIPSSRHGRYPSRRASLQTQGLILKRALGEIPRPLTSSSLENPFGTNSSYVSTEIISDSSSENLGSNQPLLDTSSTQNASDDPTRPLKKLKILTTEPSRWAVSVKSNSLAAGVILRNKDARIDLYNLLSGALVHTLSILEETDVKSLSYADDGQTLASGHGGWWYSGHYKQLSVYIWDVSTGQKIKKIDVPLLEDGNIIYQLSLHLEVVYLHYRNSRQDATSIPGFIVFGFDASIIYQEIQPLQFYRENQHVPNRVILVSEDSFRVLNTSNFWLTHKIRRSGSMVDAQCTSDEAITILHADGKLETIKPFQHTSQYLSFDSTEAGNRAFEHGRLHLASDGSILITFELHFIPCIAALEKGVWNLMPPEVLHDFGLYTVDGQYLFYRQWQPFAKRQGNPYVYIQNVDIGERLESGRKLTITADKAQAVNEDDDAIMKDSDPAWIRIE